MKVSILTPTYNRAKFLPLAVQNILLFQGDHNDMEWVILDDGDEPFIRSARQEKEIQVQINPIRLVYKYIGPRHLKIGVKRNRLIKLASNNVCINMDDDDIYFPSYISYTTQMLKEMTGGKGLVGSQAMLFIYPKNNYSISGINCPAKRQIHEGTMCFHKKYIKSMGGYQNNSQGEGAKLIDGSEKRVGNVDVMKQMCCVCHKENTVDKDQFIDKNADTLTPLQDVIKLLPQFRILQVIMEISHKKEEDWIDVPSQDESYDV